MIMRLILLVVTYLTDPVLPTISWMTFWRSSISTRKLSIQALLPRRWAMRESFESSAYADRCYHCHLDINRLLGNDLVRAHVIFIYSVRNKQNNDRWGEYFIHSEYFLSRSKLSSEESQPNESSWCEIDDSLTACLHSFLPFPFPCLSTWFSRYKSVVFVCSLRWKQYSTF